MDWPFFLKTLFAFFVIVDPVGGLPLFLSLTAEETESQRVVTALKACVAAFFVLAMFVFFGEKILQVFGISLGSFRVAGGALLFLISIQMLQAKPRKTKSTPLEQKEAMEKEDVALVPLAVPILAGPGAITTAIVLAGGEPLSTKLTVVLAAGLAMFFTFVIFSQASRLSKILGQTGSNLLVRLMGLLLSVIAVEYMVAGIRELFPVLSVEGA